MESNKITLSIKWNKTTFDNVELNLDEDVVTFK